MVCNGLSERDTSIPASAGSLDNERRFGIVRHGRQALEIGGIRRAGFINDRDRVGSPARIVATEFGCAQAEPNQSALMVRANDPSISESISTWTFRPLLNLT